MKAPVKEHVIEKPQMFMNELENQNKVNLNQFGMDQLNLNDFDELDKEEEDPLYFNP